MKQQHTSGPWRADIRHAQAMVTDSIGNAIADIARHEYSTTDQSYTDENISANARLISAAPDLLDILKAAVARIEIANEEGDKILSAWLPDARAAIAKAEGNK